MPKKKATPEQKLFIVTIPIAGHVAVTVEAASEEEAVDLAMDRTEDAGACDVSWEALDSFHAGNVCFCPQPWQVEVKEVEE